MSVTEPIINPDANMCDTLHKAVADLFTALRADGVITGQPKTAGATSEAIAQWISRLKHKGVDPAQVRKFTEHLGEHVPGKWPPVQLFFEWSKGTTTKVIQSSGTACYLETLIQNDGSGEQPRIEIWVMGMMPADAAREWEDHDRQRYAFFTEEDEDGQVISAEDQLRKVLKGSGVLKGCGHPRWRLGTSIGYFRTIAGKIEDGITQKEMAHA